MEIGIGTVQFGLDYGVSNQTGRVDFNQVEKILEFAQNKGIRYLDTAPLYGQSEETLGRLNFAENIRIITKTQKMEGLSGFSDPYNEFSLELERSLSRLKRNSVYGLMAHDPNDLINDGSDRIWKIFETHKNAGRVKKIGVSVYEESQILSILDRYPIDIIQIPVSIMDQRPIQNGILNKLKKKGVEIHVRSVFLQGSIFIDPEKLPGSLNTFKSIFSDFSNRVKKSGFTSLECALGFIKTVPEIDVVVIGVNSYTQFKEVVRAWEKEIDLSAFSDFQPSKNSDLLNPAKWVNS